MYRLAESLNLLKALPDAVKNIKALFSEMKGIPKEQTKRRELAYKGSQECSEGSWYHTKPDSIPSHPEHPIAAKSNSSL